MLAADLAAALDPVTHAAGSGFVAEGWQEGLLRTRARRVLVACARQVGKSTTTARKAVHVAVYEPGALVLIISPSQRQSDELLLRVKAIYRGLGYDKPVKANDGELVLANDSRVVSLPGTEGTSRGFAGARLLVLDEAARISDDVFASVLPMVATGGQVFALSTPWGRRGWFWELYEDETNGWERHRITVHESGQWSPQRVDEVRASVGSFVWAADYEAQFGDSQSAVFTVDAVRAMRARAVAPLALGEGE